MLRWPRHLRQKRKALHSHKILFFIINDLLFFKKRRHSAYSQLLDFIVFQEVNSFPR